MYTLIKANEGKTTIEGRMERKRSVRNNSDFCIELFRAALEDQDRSAWEQIQKQYTSLIHRWLIDLSSNCLCPDLREDLVQNTYIRFWCSFTGQQHLTVQQFPHIGAILKYLKKCTTTAFLDCKRQEKRLTRLQECLELAPLTSLTDSLDDSVSTKIQVQAIRNWLQREICDEQEKLIVQLSFVQGFTPKQIAASYPNEFADLQDVYRLKERLLKRIRRAFRSRSELRA
jgi:RNA polymerase sigma factor (sigma-70 family)